MNKKQRAAVCIYVIALVMYQVFYFGIPFPKTGAAWINYIFTWIAFIVCLFFLKAAFDGSDELESKVYGFPIFRIGYIYLIVQLVLDVIFFLFEFAIMIPFWIPLVLDVFALGMALIGGIAADTVRDTVAATVIKTKIQTERMKYFRVSVDRLSDSVPAGVVKDSLKKLETEFRYSDPVSREDLAEIETNIQSEIGVLKDFLSAGKIERVLLEQIQKISEMLSERNRLCKAGKDN